MLVVRPVVLAPQALRATGTLNAGRGGGSNGRLAQPLCTNIVTLTLRERLGLAPSPVPRSPTRSDELRAQLERATPAGDRSRVGELARLLALAPT